MIASSIRTFKFGITLFVTLFVLLSTALCFAGSKGALPKKPKAAEAQQHPLASLLKQSDLVYQKSKAIKIKLSKKVKYALLGKEKQNEGVLYLSGKNLRLELDPPQKSLVVITPEVTWLVSYLSDESDAEVQITKLKGQKTGRDKSNSTLFSLLGQGGIMRHFDLKTATEKDGQVIFELYPKQALAEVKRVELTISKSSKYIQSVAYWDDLDNETSFVFIEQELNAKIPKGLFLYKAPKGAVITEE